MHIVIDHLADLTEKQGPVGRWSQQGFEAMHKMTKLVLARMTSHDGGVGNRSALKQGMRAVLRLWVNEIRGLVNPPRGNQQQKNSKESDDKQEVLNRWVGGFFGCTCTEPGIIDVLLRATDGGVH